MSKIIDWECSKLTDDVYIIWYEDIHFNKLIGKVKEYNKTLGYDKITIEEEDDVDGNVFSRFKDYLGREFFTLKVCIIDKCYPNKKDFEILSEYEFINFVEIMAIINSEKSLNINKDKTIEEVYDNVNKPNHYQLNIKGNNIQVIDIIDEVVKDYKQQEAFKIANVIKYVLRASKKNGKEDLKKAKKYIEMLLEEEN